MTCHSYYRLYVRAREAINGIMRQDVSCVMNIRSSHRGAGVPVKDKQKLRRIIAVDQHALRNIKPASHRKNLHSA
jgi:hypothetical protein